MKQHLNRKLLTGGLLLAILLSLFSPSLQLQAGTAGDSNMNTAGGEMGNAASGWYWNGTYGARISIVDGEGGVRVQPVDFFPKDGLKPDAWMGTCRAKTQLKVISSMELTRGGGSIWAQQYNYTPLPDLPRLVAGSNSKTNLDEIVRYFTDRDNIINILTLMHSPITLDDLLAQSDQAAPADKRLIMIEPLVMAQITVDGTVYKTVMSATEAAAYDKYHGNILRSKMPSLSHMNLPFGLFLQKSDCGMLAYTGSTSGKLPASADDTIIQQGLGVGLVSFGQSMSPNADKATVVQFIDKNEDGVYKEADGDIYLNKGITWIWKYASGESYGTPATPTMIHELMKLSNHRLYPQIANKSKVTYTDPVTHESKTYSFNSAYGSTDMLGATVDSACTYIGQDPVSVEAGWSISHTLSNNGQKYYFFMGYVDPNAKRTVTLHYIFDDVEDESMREVKTNLTRGSTFRLDTNFATSSYCIDPREHGGEEYNLTDAYYSIGGKETHPNAGQPIKSFWSFAKFDLTSNADVYLVYTKPITYYATLKFVDENGNVLKGKLSDDTPAIAKRQEIVEGSTVKGTDLFSTFFTGTAYKKLTTSSATYDISKFSYQHNGGAVVSKSADSTTASDFFSKEIIVKGPIEYKLVYKKPATDKFKITLHFVDEDGNTLKSAQTVSNIVKGTKFKITEKFPTLTTESNYKEITKSGVKYTVTTAKYKFDGASQVSKLAKDSLSTFFAKSLTMTADLDYYLVYKAEESVKVKLKFVDEDGHEIKAAQTASVPKGNTSDAKAIFGSVLNVGAYEKLTVDDATFELVSAKFSNGVSSDSCPDSTKIDSWLSTARTFNNDSVYTLTYEGKVEDDSAVIQKIIILQDADGNTVMQEGPTIVKTVSPKSNKTVTVEAYGATYNKDGVTYDICSSWKEIDGVVKSKLTNIAFGGSTSALASIHTRQVYGNADATVVFVYRMKQPVDPIVTFEYEGIDGAVLKPAETIKVPYTDIGVTKNANDYGNEAPDSIAPDYTYMTTKIKSTPGGGRTIEDQNPSFVIPKVSVIITYVYKREEKKKTEDEDPIPPVATIDSGMDPNLRGELLAYHRDIPLPGKYNAAGGGIPSGKNLYGNMFCKNYLYQFSAQNVSGKETYTITVTQPYSYEYDDGHWVWTTVYYPATDEDGNLIQVPHTSKYWNTVWRWAETSVTYSTTSVRSYSYNYITAYDAYKIEKGTIFNDALNGGAITEKPKNYSPPTASCTLLGKEKENHIKAPVLPNYGRSGNTYSRTLPKMSFDRNYTGNKYTTALNAAKSEALSAAGSLPEIDVWNDSAEGPGGVVLDGTIYKGRAPGPDLSGLKANQGEIGKDTLYRESTQIPKTKENEVYSSTMQILYKQVVKESGSGGTRIPGPEELTPSKQINSVHVFTPIRVDAKVVKDSSEWIQYTSDFSYGENPVIAGKSFDLYVHLVGKHYRSINEDYYLYGNRDYQEFLLEEKGLYIQFTCPIYWNDKLYGANEKIYLKKPDTFTFTVPISVDTEKQYRWTLTAIAYNGDPDDTNYDPEFNRPDKYVARNSGNFYVASAVTNFSVYDITDYPRYQQMLIHAVNGSALIKPGTIEGYSVPYAYLVGAQSNNVKYTLPLVTNLYDNRELKGILKTGAGFRFALNTVGSFLTDDSTVIITPRFYYVSKDDTIGANRQEVDVYYTETFNDKTQKLVKVKSSLDLRNVKKFYVDDEKLCIPASLLSTTAQKLGLTGQANKEFIHAKVPIYTYGGIMLSTSVRMLPNSMANTVTGLALDNFTISTNDGRHIQTWYGCYSLPATLHICPKGYDFSDYELIDYTEDFWLKDGYIIVNFDIKVKKNGQTILRYYDVNTDVGNMWGMENGTADGTSSKTDYYDNIWLFQPGDVAVYYTDKSIRDDYSSGGTH